MKDILIPWRPADIGKWNEERFRRMQQPDFGHGMDEPMSVCALGYESAPPMHWGQPERRASMREVREELESIRDSLTTEEPMRTDPVDVTTIMQHKPAPSLWQQFIAAVRSFFRGEAGSPT